MRPLLYITLVVLFVNCSKQNTITIPVSDYSLLWVPQNDDSIPFIDDYFIPAPELTRGGRLNYLSYATRNSYFNSGADRVEVVTQRAFSGDGKFELNYTLVAGIPEANGTNGYPTKTDILQINAPTSQNELYISKNKITTSFYVLDTVSLNEKTYINVLTDSVSFFFSRAEGVISFYNGSKWYYKN